MAACAQTPTQPRLPRRAAQLSAAPTGSDRAPPALSRADKIWSAVRWMRAPVALIAARACSPPPAHLAVIYSLEIVLSDVPISNAAERAARRPSGPFTEIELMFYNGSVGRAD